MTTKPLPQNPSDGLPVRVQLDRLRHLGGQLKVFLGYYNQEPQTKDQFVQREMLRARLQTLEKRCLAFRNFRDNEQRIRDKSREDLNQLIRDFRMLEIQVKSFKQRQENL
ncbi:hypothetical protein [Robiginitalea sp.]|uniref:hypothetical protein n=1 Tax=Robiginitalea sp. TaxID=1902411 RepID=UPI003C430CAD